MRALCPQIAELKEYGDSRPLFLCYLDGERKAELAGPNLPEITRVVNEMSPER